MSSVEQGANYKRYTCQFCTVSLLDYNHLFLHEIACPFKIRSSYRHSQSQPLLAQTPLETLLSHYSSQLPYNNYASTGYRPMSDMVNSTNIPAMLRNMERITHQTLQSLTHSSLSTFSSSVPIAEPRSFLERRFDSHLQSTVVHIPLSDRPSFTSVSTSNNYSRRTGFGYADHPLVIQPPMPAGQLQANFVTACTRDMNSSTVGKRPFPSDDVKDDTIISNKEEDSSAEVDLVQRQLPAQRRKKHRHGDSLCSETIAKTQSDSNTWKILSDPMKLSTPSDDKSLTPLQCFIRNECILIFTANDQLSVTSSRGKRPPVNFGQVGICCSFCYSKQPNMSGGGGVYYPWTISSLYSAVMNLIQRHFFRCQHIPLEVREKYCNLKQLDARSGASKAYWSLAALELGLMDTPNGIKLSARTLPSPESPRDVRTPSPTNSDHDHVTEVEYICQPEHKSLTTGFTYALMRQMTSCQFTAGDRLGKRKELPMGFPGIACRHCIHDFVTGRFFPSTLKTLSDTSKTLDVLHRHILKCRNCPQQIKDDLNLLRIQHPIERASMSFGSQKTFFKRIWTLLHSKNLVLHKKDC